MSITSRFRFSLDPKRLNSPHFREGRFHNLTMDDSLAEKTFWDTVKWKLFRTKEAPLSTDYSKDDVPKVETLTQQDLLARPGQLRIVWLGHSTVWIAFYEKG